MAGGEDETLEEVSSRVGPTLTTTESDDLVAAQSCLVVLGRQDRR